MIQDNETESGGKAELEFPPAQGRVSKMFGLKRVDWCWGEDPNAWQNQHRHWLEIYQGDQPPVRQMHHPYDKPAYLEDENNHYTAFTQYWDGVLPTEQPLMLTKGFNPK